MRLRTILEATIAASALIQPLPVVAVEHPELSGSELYVRFCASCHGRAGHGDGPVAPSLKAPIPDLTRIAVRHDGHFPANWVYRVIDGREAMAAHGPRDMPIWGYEFWHEQGADVTAGAKARDLIDRLVAYLGDLQVGREPTERASAPR